MMSFNNRAMVTHRLASRLNRALDKLRGSINTGTPDGVAKLARDYLTAYEAVMSNNARK